MLKQIAFYLCNLFYFYNIFSCFIIFKSFQKSIFLLSSLNNAAGWNVGNIFIPSFSNHLPLLAVIPYSSPRIFFNATLPK